MTRVITPLPDGTVRIGAEPLAAAYIAEVHLPGLTVLVDPSDPEPVAHALVYERDLAHDTVATLFGTDAAEVVSRSAAAAVPRVDSPELERLTHLGWLTWLDRYRPVPLDVGLLNLERTVIRGEFPDDEPELAEPAQVAGVVAAARHLRENPGVPLAHPIRELIRTTFLHLPVADSERPELAHERELLQVHDEWGSASLNAADLTWLAEQLTPAAAGLLGGHRAIVGLASLDWRRVPRQLLPAPEDSVWFEVAVDHVEVTVAAPPTARPHPAFTVVAAAPARLAASLRSSDWPLPLADGHLEFDAKSGGWRGDLPIAAASVGLAARATNLDVDVRSQVLNWVAPNQGRAREAAARRWASRGLLARRLAGFGQDLGLEVAGAAALRFAARQWSAAGARERAERCVELARRPLSAGRLSLAEQWLLSSRRRGGDDVGRLAPDA